jgi:hypothetical protein
MKLGFTDGLEIKGHVRVEARDRNGRLICVAYDGPNFIVDAGKQAVLQQLGQAFGPILGPGRRIVRRMGLGDQGALIGSPFTPKVPDASWPARTQLFWELGRKPPDTILFPTPKSVRFLTAFNSADFDPSSYSSSPKICSEASLIIGDPDDGVATLIQPNKASPDPIPPTDVMLSTRTFKSVPFDPLDAVTVTVLWTIFIV